jgi:hypothetical protein
MTEQMARSLATILAGEPERAMPGSRRWGVLATCANGRFVAVEDGVGWAYRDREAYVASQMEGDHVGLLDSQEWDEWGEREEWARKLAALLGSEEYWHSGGGIWLVFYRRPDGRFAVIGSESGGLYASYEEFDADLAGEKAENHHFV